MQSKRRKADKKARSANSLQQEYKKYVSFAASVALLEASARNDPDEGRTIGNLDHLASYMSTVLYKPNPSSSSK